VSDQSDNVSSADNDQQTPAAGQSGSSDLAAGAAVQAKVESVEDHKKLKCLGMTDVE